jgi:hypothetical protein
MKNILLAILFVGVGLVASPASAQVCSGGPAFGDRPIQVGVSPSFSDHGYGFDGAVGVGGQHLFGGASLSVQSFDELDSNATAIGLMIGSDHAVNSQGRVFVCPVAELAFLSGPDLGPIDVSGIGFGVGGRVGIVARETHAVRIVPTFGISMAYEKLTADAFGFSESESESFGVAHMGVGFVFGRMFLTPTVAVPFGADGSDAMFRTVVGFTF